MESNAMFTMRSWIRQLQNLVDLKAEQQLVEVNEILEAAFTYKDEGETMSHMHESKPKKTEEYYLVKLPTDGGYSAEIRKSKFEVRNPDGTVLVAGNVAIEKHNKSGETTVIMSWDMAEVISIAMDARRKMEDVEPETDKYDPTSEMYELRAKAQQYAMNIFVAKPRNQNWHIARWNDFNNSLETPELRNYALEVFTERLTELTSKEGELKVDDLVSNPPGPLEVEEIETKARKLASDVFNAAKTDKNNVYVQRWNEWSSTMAPGRARIAYSAYTLRLDELCAQEAEPSNNTSDDGNYAEPGKQTGSLYENSQEG